MSVNFLCLTHRIREQARSHRF
ncbi:hypothetical protein EMIT0P12_20010 [Pseudomonas sp. IT-P12]